MKKRTQLWGGPGFLFLLMALFVAGIAAETFPPVIDVSRIVSEVDGFTIVQGTLYFLHIQRENTTTQVSSSPLT